MVDLLRVDRVAQALAHSQVGRLGSRGQVTYRDPDVLHMTEAGLVVSYARPFLGTRRRDERVLAYSKLDKNLVPTEHRDLHHLLIARRMQYIAHTGGEKK